jgi:Mg-chelatase subunit ChlD
MQPGDSTTVNKTLHLDALPGAADIIIAIDTTGSMATAITQAKAQATQLCTDVQNAIPGARFAVMDFKDVVDRPATQGVLILTPLFTSTCAAVQTAINTMTAGGGGDTPEAYNWVFNKAYNDPAHPDAAAITLDGSRNPAAVQFLVVLGDATPHNSPAPTVASACGNTPPADAGVDSTREITGLNANDITLLMINYGSVLSCYSQLATATGGTAVNAGGDLSNDIISQIKVAAAHIDEAHLAVVGPCALNITFSPASYTNVTTPANLAFVETIAVPSTLTMGKYDCVVQGYADGTARGNPENVDIIVTAGPPATLMFRPEDKAATNPVDTQHCVTVVVRDVLLQPVSGVTVRFTVTGSVTTSGSANTNGAGEATFCYIGPPLPGADVIKAYADTNNNNTQDPGEPFDTATKAWVLPVSTPLCEVKITNGGWIIASNGDKANFGGNAQVGATVVDVSGNEEYQDKGPAADVNVHGNVLVVICESPTAATIYGQATVNGSGSFFYRIKVQDNGEGGKGIDKYGIIVGNAPPYASGDQTLQGGNVQIHKS